MKCWLLLVLVLIMSLLPPQAAAFVETPYITPANPTTRDRISVRVHMGGCHGSYDAVDGAKLEVVAPGQLQLITFGNALDPGHPFCNAPDFVYRFDIGTLPAGSYTLQLFIRDDLSGAGVVAVGSVTFTVFRPFRIPAMNPWGLAMIALGICLLQLAGAHLRREQF